MTAEGTFEEVKNQPRPDLWGFYEDGKVRLTLKARLILWEVSLEEYEAAPEDVPRAREEHSKRLLDRTAGMLGTDRADHALIWLDRMQEHLPGRTTHEGRTPQ